MGGLRTTRTYKVSNGYMEVKAQEYRTVTWFSYWGYTDTGHLVGYSRCPKKIEKRIEKYARREHGKK